MAEEFGADWGLTSDVFKIADSDFAGPYPVGMLYQVHKNGAGTYTIFHVADGVDTHIALNLGSFHVVRFKSASRPENAPAGP